MGILDSAVIGGVTTLIDDAINKIWPNPTDKATAAAITMRAAADATIAKLQATQEVMLAEEKSEDPWTSRARPSFLYVIYSLILFSLPMGILFAFKPDTANAVIQGFHNWLNAIPEPYLTLFGEGYLGYSVGRSWDKHTAAKFNTRMN